ncbi:zinc finger CCCH domain-containing protein 20-like [Impatiens glandulifera]|uniref:zinc finger CCCH domain-containing protein 20-like n=1 Tax=Impatiens glandulifera TaxID=253017 RepID=UPI001FB0DF08|nr:zinc finger CCCH domain-containing protein 20-like [Impatiens glandulifera]
MLTVMINNGGETNRSYSSLPWNLLDESTFSPFPGCGGASFNYYGNGDIILKNQNEDQNGIDEFDISIDEFSTDRFRMYEYKVKKCVRGRSHDWTDCPFAHPGEKARRRDPTKHNYSGSICPEFRKGNCRKGDGCEFSHGVFECWLHPSRYRTQPCKDGIHCRRPVCFFAHTPEQLRVVESVGSPKLNDPYDVFLESPPISPVQFKLVNEIAASIRNLHLSPSFKMGSGRFSPRSSPAAALQRGFSSSPCTLSSRYGVGGMYDSWETTEAMERVESGKSLREKMYARLSMENPLNQVEPDVGWVSDLLG